MLGGLIHVYIHLLQNIYYYIVVDCCILLYMLNA